MKGKLWELGPFVIAVALGLYFLLRGGASVPASIPETAGPRQGIAPRTSTGPGDPTRPEDFLPDPNSKPDPNSRPDPIVSTTSARPLK